MSPSTVSDKVRITVHVRGLLSNGLRVCLTGVEVAIIDDRTIVTQIKKGKDVIGYIIENWDIIHHETTKADGKARFEIPRPGDMEEDYAVVARFHNDEIKEQKPFLLNQDGETSIALKLHLTDKFKIYVTSPDETSPVEVGARLPTLPMGKSATFKFRWPKGEANVHAHLRASLGRIAPTAQDIEDGGMFDSEFVLTADRQGEVHMVGGFGNVPHQGFDFVNDATSSGVFAPPEPSAVTGPVTVTLQRTSSFATTDLSIWPKIRRNTDALLFKNYFDFMDWVFCGDPIGAGNPIDKGRTKDALSRTTKRRALPFTDTDAYRNIKVATEAFVMANCGFLGDPSSYTQDDGDFITGRVVVPTNIGDLATWLGRYLEFDFQAQAGLLPYLAVIRRKMIDEPIKQTDIGDVDLELDPDQFKEQVSNCYGILRSRLVEPCLLELIWSYWQEEGMLVQAMNSITRRFQNIRGPLQNDPLANMEVDPLRPLNNLLWGYIQDEQHRLSVVRRNYEYDHHYGLRLSGKAVNNMRPADSRSKFLEAFHTLLSVVSRFYRLDDDTTVKADAFPVLNALKEAHLILSQGAHNQFGDLPSTARIEMLMQQWILARPEFREFLPTRIMVAYPEPWMDRVDAMKKLQGWSDTSSLHFRNLAIFGEQVLLSVRFGNWADVNDPYQALNWARYWRSEIQGYLHAYRSATAVDLSLDVSAARIDATMPSVHLVRRLDEQRRLV